MTVLSFGDRPTATIVQLALQKPADLGSEDESEAKRVFRSGTYMDDIIDSIESENVA